MMRRAGYLVTWLALAAAACSPAEPRADRPASTAAVPTASAPVAEPRPTLASAPAGLPRVVFLGDSLTAGLGLRIEQSVPSLIQARLDAGGYKYEVVNAGVSGDTSAGGLRRLEWSLDGNVQLLVVELGANDGLRGLPAADMKRNLSQLISTAQRRNIRVILTGMEAPPNYGAAYTSEFRQVFRDLANETGVVFVPFFLAGVAGIPMFNQGDGIHPNAEGARIVERTIWRALAPMLDRQDR